MIEVLIAVGAIFAVLWLLRNAGGEYYTSEEEMFDR